jgi:hypothetical protein
MWMDEKRIPTRILQWKPIGRRIRGRPRKRWIEGTEDNIQIMGIRGWRKLCARKGQNGRELLTRLKPTVSCNARRRRMMMMMIIIII